MSQAKVDYKKNKKINRKEEVKQAKLKRRITIICSTLVLVLVIGFIGYSLYTVIVENVEKSAIENMPVSEIDLSAISDYQTSLSGDDEEETEEIEEAEADTDEDASDEEISEDSEDEDDTDTDDNADKKSKKSKKSKKKNKK